MGSCERLSAEAKADLGKVLVRSLEKGKASDQEIWALTRLGARTPLYGPFHCVRCFGAPPSLKREVSADGRWQNGPQRSSVSSFGQQKAGFQLLAWVEFFRLRMPMKRSVPAPLWFRCIPALSMKARFYQGELSAGSYGSWQEMAWIILARLWERMSNFPGCAVPRVAAHLESGPVLQL